MHCETKLTVMRFQKLVLFLLIGKCSNSSCTILTEKVAFFANSVFKEFLTSVVWNDNDYVTDSVTDDVTDFIKRFQGSIAVVPLKANESNNEVIRQFTIDKSFTQTVLFAADVHEVEYFVSLLYQDLVTPIRIIVVLTKPVTNTELTELMEVAFHNDVANILIISPNNDNVTLTTYFPYKNGKCDDFTPVHLNHDTKHLFPRKFMNFHGCEIRTTMLHMSPYSRLKFENDSFVSMSGIDANVLHILLDLLNARMKVASAKDHDGLGTMVNGTPTGCFADLVNRKADILLPGLFMSRVRYPHVQFTHTHETVILAWFGPRRRPISDWLRIFQPFMSQITPALFSTSVIFVVVTMVVRRFRLHRSFAKGSVIFQTFVIFLGIEVKFETKSLPVNCLFVLWIWFCMVVRIAYQGDLVDGLQKTVLETPLRTFESAVELVDGYGGIVTTRVFFEGTRYHENFKVIKLKNVTDYLKAIEAGKRFLIVTDRRLALDSAPNIQILDDHPVTEGPICLCMRPGWPAVPDIDNVLLQSIEKGLVQKVFREHSWEWAKAVETKGDRGAKPLTLETMTGCFYGLGAMCALCTLVLIAEIVYHRIKIGETKVFYKRK